MVGTPRARRTTSTLVRFVFATLLALGLGLAALAVVWAAGAVAGGWDAETARDQAMGLGLYFGVVALRGVLPTLWGTMALVALARAVRPATPRGALLVASAVVAAAAVVPTLLTLDLGGAIPHLRVTGLANFAASVSLLAATSVIAIAGAARVTRRPTGTRGPDAAGTGP